ncbi:hypothetical protein Pmar_PMAR019803 [Perkinsus marinus ATCC 50983]|uniref:PUB domain-containing protein n=1 Tax=Perkinsus marinus (strain ATCC 50983 / TXsc) TaxID=423536 RepID=C5LRJ1_PERM5|nr:hypothetical protein Pmar_PMAR019803 [Perkinsus marinus ATCC 50983]EER00654.1 hypothetical protein Pmar_PMAR019803 [Perkinsus marinus ATCC 50983]|eukprot:XP_002767936.1 hypothetical protein Pmar_PMAR019803 [Perkinsus marinus ATCC 50983]
MELLARETERKKEGEREGRSAVENSADSRDDRVVKMLEEMRRNQLKQHADLIMALKEITAASISRSEASTGGEGLIVKAGGVVMDGVDEEEEERGVDRSVVVATESTAVGSEAAADTAESGEKKDLEGVVREMDDRMKGTAKMLLGNLVNNPKSDKFRRVNLRTPRFQAQLDTGSAARKLMEEVGFKEEGSYLVWSPSSSEGDCEDELGDVKKALALLSGEVKEDGPNGTSTRDAEKTYPPWMSTAVAATTTTTTTEVAKGGSSSGSEEGLAEEEEDDEFGEEGRVRVAPCCGDPILRVVVEISPSQPKGIILVREGDDVEEVAEQFLMDNDLPLELAGPLGERIREDLRMMGRGPSSSRRSSKKEEEGREEEEGDKMEFDLRGLDRRSSVLDESVPSPGEDSPPRGVAPRRRLLTAPAAVAADPPPTIVVRLPKRRRWLEMLFLQGQQWRREVEEDICQTPRPCWDEATKANSAERAARLVSTAVVFVEGRDDRPPGHRLHTMHERWVAEEERINRKLDPLARKIRHLVDLQRDYVAEREEAELRGATFKPAIGESQRMCPGVSRLNGSKAASADEATEQRWKRRERTAQLRGEIERQRMEECSFRPHINSKSSLIAQRRNPFRKSPFEMLYEDASQRRERRVEWESYLPEGVTFAPNIGMAHDRPSRDGSREMFFKRLSCRKDASAPDSDSSLTHGGGRHGLRRATAASDESLEGSPPRERLLFDSPPAAARTAGRSKAQRSGSKLLMPQRRRPSGDIFNRLYCESVDLRRRAAESESAAVKAAKELSSEAKALSRSREILEQRRMEKYERLYAALGDGNVPPVTVGVPHAEDPSEWINPMTLNKAGLDDSGEMELVSHIVSYVEESGEPVSLENFIAAIDYKLRLSRKPSSHLFVSTSARERNSKWEVHPEEAAHTIVVNLLD